MQIPGDVLARRELGPAEFSGSHASGKPRGVLARGQKFEALSFCDRGVHRVLEGSD